MRSIRRDGGCADFVIDVKMVRHVVEDARAGMFATNLAGKSFGEVELCGRLEAKMGFIVIAHEAVALAECDAWLAPAALAIEEKNVEEDAIDRILLQQLIKMGFDVILIIGVDEVVELPCSGLG